MEGRGWALRGIGTGQVRAYEARYAMGSRAGGGEGEKVRGCECVEGGESILLLLLPALLVVSYFLVERVL